MLNPETFQELEACILSQTCIIANKRGLTHSSYLSLDIVASDPYMRMAGEVKTAAGVPLGISSLDGLVIWIMEATTAQGILEIPQ